MWLPRAHGSQAAEVAQPIFETYANAFQKPDREGGPGSQASSSNETNDLSDDSATRKTQSSIKVHLVHDNVTQELSLEDYVLGVMRAEGPTEDQPEALKALAIAVRTFALKNIGRHARDGYDFCSTTHCQRFVVGRASEALSLAVRATAGQVLVDDRGQPIESYFGASCGGETANIGDLWGVTPPAYLRGVRDEYCETGPHAQWIDNITRAELLRALRSDARTDVGNRLDQVVISKRDDTGRAEFISLDGEHHKTVRGWDFKIIVGRVLGWNVLKSSRFEITRSGSNFVFRGSGFGHGLGLCQEGAHVMAARGASYQKILAKYFPGTAVQRSEVRDQTSENTPGVQSAAPENRGTLESGEVARWKADLLPLFQRERGLSSGKLLTVSSEHFRVTYPADVDRRDANQVLNTLESARTDYVRRASAASIAISLSRVDVRLNESTGDFTSRTGQPWWAAAATKGNRVELQPVAILKQRGVLFSTLRHELAHAVIDAIGNRAPHWLEEGFALYLAGEGPSISRYAMRNGLSDDELERRMQHPRTQDEMRGLYAQAYMTVAQTIKSQGEASIWKRIAGR